MIDADTLCVLLVDDQRPRRGGPHDLASNPRLIRALSLVCGQVETEVNCWRKEISADVPRQRRRWGSGGRGFKSPLPDQINHPTYNNLAVPTIGEKRCRRDMSSAESSSRRWHLSTDAIPTHPALAIVAWGCIYAIGIHGLAFDALQTMKLSLLCKTHPVRSSAQNNQY